MTDSNDTNVPGKLSMYQVSSILALIYTAQKKLILCQITLNLDTDVCFIISWHKHLINQKMFYYCEFPFQPIITTINGI